MDLKMNYCQACLNSGRKLFALINLKNLFPHSHLWKVLPSQGGVCWECTHIIRKHSAFTEQVLHAQKALLGSDMVQEFTSLSRLTVSILPPENDYHFNHNHDPEIDQDKTEIEKHDLPINITLNENRVEETDIDIKEENESNDEVFDEAFESKPNSDIYVELIETKKVACKKTKKKIEKESEEEIRQKFNKVVFTEEEMVRNREEKRNQPNFKKIPFKCDSCVLGFTRKDTYDLHIQKKHDENNGPYQCQVCLIRFTSQKQVDRHSSKHYVCYRCRLCKYETLELWSAVSHCRSKHDEDQLERIHCTYCHYVAQTPDELSQHTTAEHSVYCNECGEKFKALTTLKSHIRRIHKVKREFVCDICTKTFKSKSRLESHMAHHNAHIAQKLSYCGQCRVQYKNIYVYRNHLRTSANHADTHYECVDCNKRFASKVYWKKHYNFYHLHKSQYRCDICNKLFISDWRLRTHRQTQHGSTRSRDHHCNVCGKQFFTLSTLKGHQLTHSEQRSFMCEDCGDTFKQRPALYTHYKLVHRGVKRTKKL